WGRTRPACRLTEVRAFIAARYLGKPARGPRAPPGLLLRLGRRACLLFRRGGDRDRAVGRLQIFLRHAPHVVFGDGGEFLELRVDQVRVVVKDRVFAQPDGRAERALERLDRTASRRIFGLLQFPIGDWFALQPADLFVDRGFDVFDLLAGRD